ncbi:MAG TPA: GerMN domain-containing protein [Acidimicrobiia bacterium]
MRRLRFVFLAAVVAGCGIPLDSAPEAVELEAVAVADAGGPIPGDLAAVSMYLVREASLVNVTRDLPAPPTLEIVFDSLFGPVTEPEQRSGLRTAIPRATEILAVDDDGATLQVNLSREFAAVGGDEEVLAVAQIVMTVTRIEGIELVAFKLEGVPTDVPVANGALSDDPVGAEDYASLIAP